MFKKRNVSNIRKRTKDEAEGDELGKEDAQIEVADLLELRKHKRKLAGVPSEELLKTRTQATFLDDEMFKKVGLRAGWVLMSLE